MYVIIPVKPFNQSKSRLGPVLSTAQRAVLSRLLLLRTIRLSLNVGQVVVISRDQAARQAAKQAGAWALVESGNALNEALRQASEWIATRDGQALLILPGDLPFLRPADLSQIADLGQHTPSIVIAPCHRGDGTNALLMRPPRLIDVAFGRNSFERHQRTARAVGIEPAIYRSATVAFDLDCPEDLGQLFPGLKFDAALRRLVG